MLRLFLLIIIFNCIHGKFFSKSDSTSLIILKHIRLSTDNKQYFIRCPYNLNNLKLHLLNYSNDKCFNLYLTSNNNICKNYYSSCQFHAKPIQLYCNYYSYSNYVDITYQCSYKRIISSAMQRNSFNLRRLSLTKNSEENIALFLISLGIIIILWILICCIWFIRYRHDDEKSEFISEQSYSKEDIINFNLLSNKNNSLIVDNLCLHVNPFENNHTSSLKTTQII